MNIGWRSSKTNKVLLCLSLTSAWSSRVILNNCYFVLVLIKNNSCSNYYRIHIRWMNSYNSCWRNYIHNTDAKKCRKTNDKKITHESHRCLNHIGNKTWRDPMLMEFRSPLFLKQLTLVRISWRWLKQSDTIV